MIEIRFGKEASEHFRHSSLLCLQSQFSILIVRVCFYSLNNLENLTSVSDC